MGDFYHSPDGNPPMTPRKADGFELAARVGVYLDVDFETTRHYTLYITNFGIRKGQELSGNNINDNGIRGLVEMMKKMKRPTPMTLLWTPPNGQQLLFADIRRKKLRIEFSFVRYGNGQVQVKSLLTLDKVKIVNISKESIGRVRQERIDARFSEIEMNPN